MKKISEYKSIIYELVFAILALTAVVLAVLNMMGKISPKYYTVYVAVDAVIWAIFVIDYIIGLVRAESKKHYFKTHIWDLLSLIPFDSLFRAFRLFRLFRLIRLFRAAVFFKRFSARASDFLHFNGFIYTLYFTVICILLGSILIYCFEHGKTIDDFGDAIWWSFVTTTTVGYGDISPASGYGRIVAAVLMIIGIGFISMLTSTITSFFVKRISYKRNDACALTDEELDELENYKQYIISKRTK